MNHASLIAFKGVDAIADACGVPKGHVRVWRLRGIPRTQYGFLVEAFDDVTTATLIAGEPAKPKSAKAKAAAKREAA